MKKLIVLLFLMPLGFFYQPASAQCIEEGNVIVDAYYGWPNLWTTVLKNILVDPTSSNIKVGTLGPLGGRVEYLLSDKIGIGIDIHSATSSVSWNSPDTIGGLYDYKVSVNRLRICPRINIHFSSNENLDFYGAFGIGYKNSNVKIKTSDPKYNEDSFPLNMTPVTWRAAIGLRYFFTENIGASLEMGLGGVLATGGISLKF